VTRSGGGSEALKNQKCPWTLILNDPLLDPLKPSLTFTSVHYWKANSIRNKIASHCAHNPNALAETN